MDLTTFGSDKPAIASFYGGYRVPVALHEIDGPADAGAGVTKVWRGYLIELPGLTGFEFDRVAASLPPGDYSGERLAVLAEAVRLERKAEYPPIEDYIDGVVKGDDAQVAAYKAKCLAVKAAHPLPS
jgi:hypothetical protein